MTMQTQQVPQHTEADVSNHWNHRHLVGIEPLSADEIRVLLTKAKSYENQQ